MEIGNRQVSCGKVGYLQPSHGGRSQMRNSLEENPQNSKRGGGKLQRFFSGRIKLHSTLGYMYVLEDTK